MKYRRYRSGMVDECFRDGSSYDVQADGSLTIWSLARTSGRVDPYLFVCLGLRIVVNDIGVRLC
jgi:hypothetical protein